MIRVRLADPQSNQVALWERHPDHPAGEVFLAGDGIFEVAATPAVEARLRKGRLVLVEPAVAPDPAKAKTEAEPTTEVATEEVAAETEPPPAESDDSAGRVLAAEEPAEEVSVVTRLSGDGAPKRRAQRRKAKGGL